ncbi:hypothetical protein K2173_000358 [Erythroxylum novogranatense]|uniref:Uncharacterized protein n=1 Tax=Erythroxylum novogranatense TaxID=1862640 RepID=A0AAV8SW24_9ROSI|nr:hypothetical protein K2173_000358 [Erythroxylum novogranatense]
MVKQKSKNRSVLGRLKNAVKRIKLLLDFNIGRWRIASFFRKSSTRHSLSFNDRFGLHGCLEDEELDRTNSFRSLQRTRSCVSEEDVDRRAEMFIENFRRQLLYERQVSLELRYHRGHSFGRR